MPRVYALTVFSEDQPGVMDLATITLDESQPDMEAILNEGLEQVLAMRIIISHLGGMGKHGTPKKPRALFRLTHNLEMDPMMPDGIMVQMRMKKICSFDSRNLPIKPEEAPSNSRP